MRTAVLFLGKFSGNDIDFTVELFDRNGYRVDETVITDDEIAFINALSRLKVFSGNLIIIDGENGKFDVKEKICSVFNTTLVENENAKRFIEAVSNSPDGEREKSCAYLPDESILIPNVLGIYQGFMIEDENLVATTLPFGKTETERMAEKYLFPYLEKKFDVRKKKLTLKFFGDGEELKGVLENSKGLSNGEYNYYIKENNGDYSVYLFFDNYTEKDANDVIRYIVSKLAYGIYAEKEQSLSERLFDYLTIKNKKISFAESFTGGRLSSALVKNSGASKVFREGIVCYSNESKIEMLGVKKEDIERNGAVSSVVAYEMAVGLLKKGADIAVATTGLAGPKSDESNLPVGLNFIAVGTKDGIHTYKYSFSGTREEITERAVNTATFLAIKNLKKD